MSDVDTELDIDWIHPWIGLDWIGSEVLSAHCFFEDGSAFV